LPPGRAKLAIKPLTIGSVTTANTMGMVLVSRMSAPTAGWNTYSSCNFP
jgi:hypothetical protein